MAIKDLRLSLIGAGALALMTACGANAAAPRLDTTVSYDASIVPLSPKVQVIGEAAANTVVHFQVALNLRDDAGLTRKNHDGVVLAYRDLEAQHLPTPADYNRVLAWLTASGFTVDQTSPERLVVHASGTTGQVRRALGVHFSEIASEGKRFTSADSAPRIPTALADVVQSINGLQPQLHARKMNRRAAPRTNAGSLPPITALVGYPASTFVKAYGGDAYANDGAGSTTAIVIDTFPLATDLQEYWTLTNTPQSLNNISFIQAVLGVNDPPEGEESMDTEITSSMAPKSKVRVYASSTLSDANLDTTYQRIISDMHSGVQIDQVSISLGECETDVSKAEAKTDDNFFAVISSLGASVFVSSGDSGSLECDGSTVDTPSFYSTSPNVTAVGGTSLAVDTTSSSPYAETSWDGSGGGVSVLFRTPVWQKGLGYARRAVPDVSADADPNTGAMVILAGLPIEVGGTSLSAPIWAGLMARVNSARHAAGKGGVGLINRYTTKLVSTTNFRDVTEGSNGGFTAGPGFDLVTGVGSPLMDKLGPKLEAKP